MIKLTARQINYIDEINRDKKASKETLEVAISHHENRLNELIKKQADWWDEIAEIHSLDLGETEYKVDFQGGFVAVVEKDK